MPQQLVLLLTLAIIAVIAVVTIRALRSDQARFVSQAPSVLTSLGIFGTFLGITVGLAAFNPGDIASSVPLLFGGIKLAFWTSVAGILGGILVKLRILLYGGPGMLDKPATVNDVVGVLQQVERSLNDDNHQPLLAGMRADLAQANARAANLDAQLAKVAESLNQNRHSQREQSDATLDRLAAMQADAARSSEQLAAALKAAQDAQGELTSARLAELQQAMVAATERLAGDLAAARQAEDAKAAERLGALQEAMVSATERLGADLAAARDSADERTAARLAELQEALVTATRRLGENLAAQQAQSETTGAEQVAAMRAATEAASERLAAALHRAQEAQVSALAEQLGGLKDQLSSDGRETGERMRDVAQAVAALRGALGEDSAALLAQLGKLESGTQALGDTLGSAMADSNARLADALAAGNAKLTDALAAGNSELSARLLADNSRLAEELAGGQKALIDAIGKDSANLGKVIASGQAQLAAAVADQREAIAARIGSAVEAMQQSIGEGLASGVHDIREAMLGKDGIRDTLAGELAGLGQRLAAIDEDFAATHSSLNELAGGLNDLGGGIAGDFDKVAAGIADAIDELRLALVGPEGASAALGGQLASLQDKLAGSQQAGAEQMQAVGGAIRQLREALGEDSGKLLEQLAALRGESDAVGAKLGEALAAGNERLAQALEANRDAMAAEITAAVKAMQESVGNDLSAGVYDIRDALVGPEGLRDVLGDRLQHGQAELAQALAGATGALGEALGAQLDAVQKRLAGDAEASTEQMRGLVESIRALRGAMGEDSATLLKNLDALREGSTQLGEALAADNEKLITALEGQRDAMAASIAAAVNSMRESVGQGLADGVHDIRNALIGPEGVRQSLVAELAGLGSRMDKLDGSLQKTVPALTGSLETASAGMRSLIEELGHDLNKALRDLHLALVGPEGATTTIGELLQNSQLHLADALAKTTEGFHRLLSGDIERLQERLAASSNASQQQMHAIAEAVKTLREALGEDAGDLLGKLDALDAGSKALGERLGGALAEGNAQLARAIEGQRDAIAAQIASAVGDMRDSLGSNLASGVSDIRNALVGPDGVSDSLGSEISAMRKALDTSAEALSASVDGLSGEVSEDFDKLAAGVAAGIEDLRMALVGPEHKGQGLAAELKAGQERQHAALDSIRQALDENTQRQVDYSPKGLMQVLEQLIEQFNTQFQGQFWEKLDGFNQGIAELLGWMETYRKQLGDMTDQQAKSAKNMDLATRRFDEVASKSEIFVDVAKNISLLLGALDSQRVQVESHLKRFASIVKDTSSHLEDIEDQIVAGHSQMNKNLTDIAERIEDQVVRVDQAMEEELTKAMTTFGQQLAALSEKFVSDYTPLTEKLRDLVEFARDVKR